MVAPHILWCHLPLRNILLCLAHEAVATLAFFVFPEYSKVISDCSFCAYWPVLLKCKNLYGSFTSFLSLASFPSENSSLTTFSRLDFPTNRSPFLYCFCSAVTLTEDIMFIELLFIMCHFHEKVCFVRSWISVLFARFIKWTNKGILTKLLSHDFCEDTPRFPSPSPPSLHTSPLRCLPSEFQIMRWKEHSHLTPTPSYHNYRSPFTWGHFPRSPVDIWSQR